MFIIIWIAPETLCKIIKKVLRETITLSMGIKILILEVPKILAKAIPVGIFLGSLYTFDRLSKNCELAILRGIGISFNRIMLPVVVFSLFLTLFCYIVNDKLVPISSIKLGEAPSVGSHFVYVVENPDKTPKQNIIVSNFNDKLISGIIIMNFSNENYSDATTFKNIVFAPNAYYRDDHWLVVNGIRYDIDSDGIYHKVRKIKRLKILTSPGEAAEVKNLMLNAARRERVFTNSQIYDYSKLLKKAKFSDEYRYFRTKLYQRFFHPFTCVIFAILGCLLGFAPPRSQRLIGFTIAVGMIFGYYITLPFFDLLAQKAVLPPLICAIFPIAIFIVSIFIVKKVKDL